MARGRKSQYISKLTCKDQNMLRAFRNVGYMTKEQLREKIGMAERRIENFVRDKHLEKVTVFDKHTKSLVEAYRLTEKGQEFTRQQLDLNNFYRSVSVNHDLALAQKYLEATPEQQQNWITEKDWRDRLDEEIARLRESGHDQRADEIEKMREQGLISLPDGGYVQGETVVAVEIITKNYGQAEIQAKTEFAQAMNVEYQSYKI